MIELQEVRLAPRNLEEFEPLIGTEAMAIARSEAERSAERLRGRTVWNVNSTAVGGGVAEMLPSLIGYARGAGIDARWIVIDAPPEFFALTKRIHHALHGANGDGRPLDEAARALYEEALRDNAIELGTRVRPGDVAILHDPQTAGLAPHLAAGGVRVIWRCHIGHDAHNDDVQEGWAFLRPYLEAAEAFVFSRASYAPSFIDKERMRVIPPSIDAFSAKNRELDADTVQAILVHVGIVEGPPPPGSDRLFLRQDGTPTRVDRQADVIRLGRAPALDTPLVVQVSRWDRLKDMAGVMHGFARLVDNRVPGDAELVLAGPNVHAVADDPEGAEVLNEVVAAWRALPHPVRARIHIVSLPTRDVEENAAIVNALQRHAAIVVQKSLHEGFGLTVTEAMWKHRAVVASAVGGIQDQIEPGVSGQLLKDPSDLETFAEILTDLLEHPEAAARLGEEAHRRVTEHFLGVRHLMAYAGLLEEMTGGVS